jgi:outer membrane protein TolC
VHSLFVNNRRGGEAEAEAQAREQFFRFQEEVENAFGGRRLDYGRHEAFQGLGGVQSNERRLRRLLGLPISDGRLLRPVEEPTMARMVFDWNAVLCESLVRRAELRRQQWLIRRHELECVAAKNFLKPRLDAIGRYRFRGLGSDLLDPRRSSVDRFDNAYQNLTSGDFQEWHLGVELTAPLGFRQAHVAVRNAELRLARTRAVYDEQQREIVHDLSSAFADLERSYTVSQTNLNRMIAAQQQLYALEALDDNEKPRRLDLLLDAQKRMADAESRYHRSLIEHTLAIKAVHRAKGSLLDYDEVHLTEGCWPEPACADAANREARRGCPLRLTDYRMARSPLVSAGVYAQDALPVGEDEMP